MHSFLKTFFERIDRFGVFLQLTIMNDEYVFKTIYGGIISFLIYIISIAFFCYQMFMWQTNQIPPSVVQYVKVPDISAMNFTHNLFRLQLYSDYSDNELLQIVNNTDFFWVNGTYYGEENVPMKIFNNKNYDCGEKQYKWDLYYPICQCFNDTNQTYLYIDEITVSYWEYKVFYCNITSDLKCLSDKQKTIFFNHQPYWQFLYSTQDYDYSTGQITQIPYSYYFPFNSFEDKPLYFQLKITVGIIHVDKGLIFQDWDTIKIVKDISFTQSTVEYQENVGPTIMVSLDKKQYVTVVKHVKFGQILAETGSIIQFLLFSGIFFMQVNRNMLRVKIEDLLLVEYFPDILKYKIIKNHNDVIKSVHRNKKQLTDLEKKQFIYRYSQLKSVVRRKLCHFQILKDLNFIQIALQHLFTSDELVKFSKIRYLFSDEQNNISNQDFQILEGYLALKQFFLFHQSTEGFLLDSDLDLDKGYESRIDFHERFEMNYPYDIQLEM